MQTKQVFEYKQKSRKMRMKNVKSKMIAAAVGTLMLAACNSEESLPSGETAQDMAHFSATISGPVTRAYNTVWEVGDEIGISGKSGEVQYANVCYSTSGSNGNFSPKDEKIYYQTDKEVTFTAYYPWDDLKGGETIAADTKMQANQKDFDFLWAQAKGSKSSPNVAFRFAHRMAKVVLTVKKGSDVSYEEVQQAVLALAGFKNAGTFNVEDGTTAATGDATAAWTFFGNTENTGYNVVPEPDEDSETVSYSLIVFPQEFAAKLPFTATLTDEQSFTADLDFTAANAEIDDVAKNEWVAGRQYNMGIVLNKTGIKVEGCTIAPWEEVSGGDIDAQ